MSRHNSNKDGCPFVSRGGLKLHHALEAFDVSPAGMRCADLGCSTGGFTDCLLQGGAVHVTSVDTGYGVLAWKLRNDPRVRVMERTNALHAPPPSTHELCDLVVIDMGWTQQRLCVPAAAKWLKPGGAARIITLIKPHYELSAEEKARLLERGVLRDADAEAVARRTAGAMPALGYEVRGLTACPVRGSGGSKEGEGNQEWLALLRRTTPDT